MIVNIIFYTFSFLAIIGSLVVVSSKNPVIAVIAKVSTFFSVSVIWITMQQEYLALLLILIYVGAVLVMFLFVVMMIDIDVTRRKRSFILHLSVVTILCSILGLLVSVLTTRMFSNSNIFGGYGTVRAIGEKMFSDSYLYPFELAAMVLLTALVAAITLTLRGKKIGNKSGNPIIQVTTNPDERLTLIEINPEKNKKKGG
jgi:NADH-quinone oxidoreductase subunit J